MKTHLLHFFFTGGTIDSYYEVTKDTAVPCDASVIPQYIQSLKLKQKTIFTEICMKDSREITDKDRRRLAQAIEKSSSTKNIVTHGTYTMQQTAEYLKKYLHGMCKTVILTGSMLPLTGFAPSDAGFSLGFAVAKVEDLPPGVYVCMNGQVFDPESVRKNVTVGRFESV